MYCSWESSLDSLCFAILRNKYQQPINIKAVKAYIANDNKESQGSETFNKVILLDILVHYCHKVTNST